MTTEEYKYPDHWDSMTYVQRIALVSALFDSAAPYDTLWCTTEPFEGWHKWWIVRWDDVC